MKVSKEGLELSELRIESQLLRRLCNQIPSSAHSSVVQGHVEFLGFLKGDSERRPTGPELQLLSRVVAMS